MNYPTLFLLSLAALMLASIQTLLASEAGKAAPVCALSAVGDSKPYNLQQFQGKVLYVDFWASWCGPCAKSFPFLNNLNREFKGRGLQIIGINLDEKPDEAKSFLSKYPANFTVAADVGGECAKNFGVEAMPSSYLIDRNGVIRHIHLGFRTGEAEEIKAWVGRLLAENPSGH
jgi:thiol-disulfide isomerase/thioredoxin